MADGSIGPIDPSLVLETSDDVLQALEVALRPAADELDAMVDGIDLTDPGSTAAATTAALRAQSASAAAGLFGMPVTSGMPVTMTTMAMPQLGGFGMPGLPLAPSFPLPQQENRRPPGAIAVASPAQAAIALPTATVLPPQPPVLPVGGPPVPPPTILSAGGFGFGSGTQQQPVPGGGLPLGAPSAGASSSSSTTGGAAGNTAAAPPSTRLQGIFLPSLSEMPSTGSPKSAASPLASPTSSGSPGKSPRSFVQGRGAGGPHPYAIPPLGTSAGALSAPPAFRRIDPKAASQIDMQKNQNSFKCVACTPPPLALAAILQTPHILVPRICCGSPHTHVCSCMHFRSGFKRREGKRGSVIAANLPT